MRKAGETVAHIRMSYAIPSQRRALVLAGVFLVGLIIGGIAGFTFGLT